MNFLKDNFKELFNVCRMCLDLMELIEDEKLEEFIKEEIRKNFTKEELREKFKYSNKDGADEFINSIYEEEESSEEGVLTANIICKSKKTYENIQNKNLELFIIPGAYATDRGFCFDFENSSTDFISAKDGYIYAIIELEYPDFDFINQSLEENGEELENDSEVYKMIKNNFEEGMDEIVIYVGEEGSKGAEFEAIDMLVTLKTRSKEEVIQLLKSDKKIEDILHGSEGL